MVTARTLDRRDRLSPPGAAVSPPTRPDPRTILLACATLLIIFSLTPPLDARPSASTGPAAPAAPTAAPAPVPGALAPGTGSGAAATGTQPPGRIPPELAPAAAGWRSPTGAPVGVVRGFEPPATPYGAGHRGVDVAAPPGSAVRAAGDGLVAYAGPLAGRGVVVVSHGALRTTYEPVAAAVAAGARVRAGEVVGRLDAGHPGCPDGCLHWGLLRGGVYLDPLSLLRPARPRLLPLAPRPGPGPPRADQTRSLQRRSERTLLTRNAAEARVAG
jgi:murein DD-endopeptidase MepM/ murein hydrolase activator NlpD